MTGIQALIVKEDTTSCYTESFRFIHLFILFTVGTTSRKGLLFLFEKQVKGPVAASFHGLRTVFIMQSLRFTAAFYGSS